MNQNKIQTIKLDNGFKIAVVNQHSHSIFLHLGIKAGSTDELDKENGLAHLTEHMYFRSNELRSAEKLESILQSSGFIENNAETSFFDTRYWVECLNSKVSKTIDLMCDSIKDSNYLQNEFEQEKEIVLSELRMCNNNPLTYFYDNIFYPNIFKGSPLEKTILGTQESLQGLTIEQIQNFKQRFYNPNNMVLVVEGGVNIDKLIKKVEKTFGKLPYQKVKHNKLSVSITPGLIIKEMGSLKQSNNPDSDQSFLYLTYSLNKINLRDINTLKLLNHLVYSPIFNEIREKRGFCYGIDTDYDIIGGTLVYSVGIPGIHPKNVKEAIEVIQDKLYYFGGQLNNNFFERKKGECITHLEDLTRCSGLWADFLIESELFGSKENLHEIPGIVQSIGKKRVSYLANKIFQQEPLIIAAMPPGYKL